MSTGTGASDLLHAEDTAIDQIVSGRSPVAARSPLQLFWGRFKKDKGALGAGTFIIVLVLVAIFAEPIRRLVGAPAPNLQQATALDEFGRPQGPSSAHRCAVAQVARDRFSRTLAGARVSL